MRGCNGHQTIAFIGAGPGDPDLLTRKGWRLLEQADVVLHDALIDVDGFRQAAPLARWINVGKRLGRVSTAQSFISKSLVNLSMRGYKVVRLKGGDPTIFGRLTEEIEACRAAHIEIEIVPGITAACASAAELEISLTQRDVSRSVTFMTPRMSNSGGLSGNWIPVAVASDTVVLYMAGAELSAIARTLLANGRHPQTPVAVIESASRLARKTLLTLQCCLDTPPVISGGPVTVVIGEVVKCAMEVHRLPGPYQFQPQARAQ